MMAKTFSKKLILNKKTVAHLSNRDMIDVPGGRAVIETIDYCPLTWGEGSCPTGCETIPGISPCPGVRC
jgi:hypothetical protein